MTDKQLRYLYRRQESTGIWIQEHGPFRNERAAVLAAARLWPETSLRVGICTSPDGRTVITEQPPKMR